MANHNPSQASLLPEVAHARHGDPEESFLAAAKVVVSETRKEQVLACFVNGPCHDEEMIRRFRDYFPNEKITDQRLRSYRSTLVHPRWPEQPRLEKTGERVRTSNGYLSAVHRLVQP